MNCPKCYRSIKPSEVFCPGCGNKVRDNLLLPSNSEPDRQELSGCWNFVIGIIALVFQYVLYFLIIVGFYKINIDPGFIGLFLLGINFLIVFSAVLGWYGSFTFLGLFNIILIGFTPLISWILVPSIGKGVVSLLTKQPRVLKNKPSPIGLIICIILFLAFMWSEGDNIFGLSQAPSSPVSYWQPSPTFVRSNLAAPTRTPYPTQFLLPQDDCIDWSKVTASMEGQYKCVWGKATDIYFDESLMYIRFSDKATSFYFVTTDGGYFPDLTTGECAQTSGVIKTWSGIPHIEITEKLYDCSN